MAKQAESALTRKMVKRINDLPCPTFAHKVHGTRYSSGEPDIDAVIRGVPVKVEVKMPGNSPTPLQADRLLKWETAGAVTGWVRTMDELDAIIGIALRQAGETELAERLAAGEL